MNFFLPKMYVEIHEINGYIFQLPAHMRGVFQILESNNNLLIIIMH